MKYLQKMIFISLFREKVLNNYNMLFHYVDQASKCYSLDVKEVAVTSGFNGIISTEYGLDLGLIDTEKIIDRELYRSMANIVHSDKVNNDLKIRLGYGLRSIDLIHMNASITTGSHCAVTNTISLDISSYNLLGLEAMIHRFGHEMLHEFGFKEKEVLKMEDKYYDNIKDIACIFIKSFYTNLSYYAQKLDERIETMFVASKYMMQLLNETYVYLLTKNTPNLYGAAINTIHPISKLPFQINFL